jgi:iron complex outermembrane receptor protein
MGLAVLVAAAPLYAQTIAGNTTAATGTQPEETGGLQEITVTAQRRTENLQDVPISVTSFSASTLATQQIDTGLDLGRVVPNFFASNNVGQGSANVYYIRGLGQTQSFPTFEPQVGTYVDDIYIARQNANNFSLFGVQQLQVLNGPQGTLFGRNSTGGAIVVTLAKPDREFGGDGQVSYGSFNSFSGRFSVSIPITEEILTRTSVYGITDDGYVEDLTTHQTLNAKHNWGVREAVSFLPKDFSNIDWELSADYEHNDSANLLNQPSATGGVNGSDRISYSGYSTDGGALADLLAGEKRHYGQGALVLTYGATSNFKVSFEAGTLNFISGLRALEQSTGADFPAASLGPLPTADAVPTGEITLAQDLGSHQYSQEIKWTGQSGDWLNYTTGVFYLHETNNNDYGQILGLSPTLAFALNDQFVQNQTASSAAYAQGDFKITPRFTVTAGGRFTHELKTVEATPNAPGLGYTTADIAAEGYPTRLTANEFTPRLALQYQIDPQLMAFISATRGFQGGGWNGLTGSNPKDFNNFGPETLWSYEAGVRFESADRRLRLNSTAFYEDVGHYQLLSDNPFTNSFDTSNAANMAAYGLETSLTWQPIDPFMLSANVSSIFAHYYNPSQLIVNQQAQCRAGVAATCDSGIVTADGQLAKPVYTPPLAANVTASYVLSFPGFTLTPTLGLQFVTREWFDTANTAGFASSYPTPAGGEDRARTLLDVGVTLAPRNLPLTVTAECKNCTMVNYGTADLLAFDYFNTPGSWDVVVRYKF